MYPRSPPGSDTIAASQDQLTCDPSPLHWNFLTAETQVGAQPSSQTPTQVSEHP